MSGVRGGGYEGYWCPGYGGGGERERERERERDISIRGTRGIRYEVRGY